MKVIGEETVVRYHIEFDETETLLLKTVGWLPPEASSRARLWSTEAEVADTKTMLADLTGKPLP